LPRDGLTPPSRSWLLRVLFVPSGHKSPASLSLQAE
jgi:hypothetical protein